MTSCSTFETKAAGRGCGDAVVFDGASPAYRRALMAVIGINILGFVVVAIGSWLADSAALAANTLDFAADAATYTLSLWAIGKSVQVRSGAAFVKSASLALMAGSRRGEAGAGLRRPRRRVPPPGARAHPGPAVGRGA
jgi:Co/Zn/Cd efflux system component